jgi:hypothetical protein
MPRKMNRSESTSTFPYIMRSLGATWVGPCNKVTRDVSLPDKA